MNDWLSRTRTIKVIVTPELLKVSMPNCPDPTGWSEAFNVALDMFPVKQVAMLLAQVGHESMDLTTLEENLNYSAKRLTKVWPNRYPTREAAQPYANNPEALANDTYGGRLGNMQPGDGWKYRGRGPLQVTGRYNYEWLEKDSELPVIEQPDLLSEDMEAGAISACHYYMTRVTTVTIEDVTREIQGGQLGVEDRLSRYNRTMKAMLERR